MSDATPFEVPTAAAPGGPGMPAASPPADPPFGELPDDLPDTDADPVDVGELGFEALQQELTSELDDETTLEIPGRPGYSVVFWIGFEWEELNAWRKKAKDKRFPTGTHEVRAGALILVNTCRAILRHGGPVELDGRPWTFRERSFLGMYPDAGGSTVEAVRKFYGRDAHVIAASLKVLDAAGYGEEILEGDAGDLDEDADPTRRAR